MIPMDMKMTDISMNIFWFFDLVSIYPNIVNANDELIFKILFETLSK